MSRLKLDCATIQDKHPLIHYRTNESHNRTKKILLSFDNSMYQTIAMFHKSSGFLEWEPNSSNGAKNIV